MIAVVVTPAELLTRVPLAPLPLVVITALVVGYVVGLRRWNTPDSGPWPFWRTLSWSGAMVMLVIALLSGLASRVTGVYLSIITQAMTYALLLAFFRNDMGFGGANGLTDFKDVLGFNVQADATRAALFSLSAIALMLGYLMARALVTSKFGKVVIAIRDAESRTRFIGYRVETYKVIVFTISAMMAGVAGALYVPQVGIINPGEFTTANSIEAVIWVAVGGRGTLVGGALGAVLVNLAKTYLTGAFPEFWLFALGALFIIVTLFLPRGVLGVGADVMDRLRARAARRAPQPPVAKGAE